jgi:hypothetical protein
MTRGLGIVAVLALIGVARPAWADEPVSVREPRLMSETAEITTVADAFDKDDPFDLNLVLGFTQSGAHAKIRRETQLNQAGLATGGFIPASENIASYSSTMSTLLVGADVGIYQDLALILRLPVILSWSQQLGDLDGSSAVAAQRLVDPSDPSGNPLFSVPFKSPTRSGLDYISAGLDWAIYNQQRDETKPTWVIGIEGRFHRDPAARVQSERDAAVPRPLAGPIETARQPRSGRQPRDEHDRGKEHLVASVRVRRAVQRVLGAGGVSPRPE